MFNAKYVAHEVKGGQIQEWTIWCLKILVYRMGGRKWQLTKYTVNIRSLHGNLLQSLKNTFIMFCAMKQQNVKTKNELLIWTYRNGLLFGCGVLSVEADQASDPWHNGFSSFKAAIRMNNFQVVRISQSYAWCSKTQDEISHEVCSSAVLLDWQDLDLILWTGKTMNQIVTYMIKYLQIWHKTVKSLTCEHNNTVSFKKPTYFGYS